MRCVFTLSTARSGTRFLYELAKRNLAGAVCRHEPYFDPGSSPMFGPAVAARTRGDLAYLRGLLEKKKRFIDSRRADVYVETSHAFLKSYYDLAPEYFPDLKLVHLVRDPLKCSVSESTRTRILDWIRLPGRRYRDSLGRSCLRWSLTGFEPIYAPLEGTPISRFQFHLVEWIELHNRAVDFLDRFDKHADCVVLDSPRELNDAGLVSCMFTQLGLERRGPNVVIAGKRNRTPLLRTTVTDRHLAEAAAVLKKLPAEYLEVFRRPLFERFTWTASLLNRYEGSVPVAAANPTRQPVG